MDGNANLLKMTLHSDRHSLQDDKANLSPLATPVVQKRFFALQNLFWGGWIRSVSIDSKTLLLSGGHVSQ